MTLTSCPHHSLFIIQKFDINGNPNLEMPPKPRVEVQGAGPEFYNIDFDAKQLQEGAVVASSKSVKSKWLHVHVHLHVSLFVILEVQTCTCTCTCIQCTCMS